LLDAGLVDELVVYLAPHLLGSSARGMFNIPGLENMANRIALDIQDVRAVGNDWRITARVNNNAGS
jgi:diaminohydroxyphosphoribosylaminopyrimidine deaminase/5-amino-6-(5-phosphoribosylamino)uracil reductase